MEKKDHEFCLRCGRKLKNPIAREKGYGAVCEKKMVMEQGTKLFNPEVRCEMSAKMYKVTYHWYDREVIEEIPAMNVKHAEELLMQKIRGAYTKEELDEARFYIIGIE